MAGTPPGFDADAVRAGLRFAMEFGLPSEAVDQPTFFMPVVSTTSDEVDAEGVPYDPGATLTTGTAVRKRVDCAVEYIDGEGKIETFGILNPSKIKLTLLDEEFAQIDGFYYVVIKGQKYYYQRSEPPIALGTVDVHTIYCRSSDEG